MIVVIFSVEFPSAKFDLTLHHITIEINKKHTQDQIYHRDLYDTILACIVPNGHLCSYT